MSHLVTGTDVPPEKRKYTKPKIGKYIRAHRWAQYAVIVLVLLFLVLTLAGNSMVLVIAFYLLGSFSTIYRRFRNEPPAIELISLTTVAVGVVHGPFVGLLFGGITELTAEIINGRMDAFALGYVPGRMIMGLLAGLLSGAPILLLGPALVVASYVASQFMYLLYGDPERKFSVLAYIFFNLPWNLLMFSFLGEFAVSIL